ncbi:hypothetical protein NLX86_11260 [Streptomyces sp. A3M-1-3]|uniref:hypothetical protein n=1 Tax=Streptomyces sp. A3M-1-3 TaxID=2962044 RepID=UPI0020B83FE5|nr:hypothetical protein [Streptomyces sp. A3M-1-3]MCP3818676.1 hypothetical protein [Streptomyces sp. A3M-1-3]
MPGIDECLLEAMTLPGARGAAVVEWISGLALGTIGDSPNGSHETTAAETAELARMAAEQTAFAAPVADGGPGDAAKAVPVEDVVITTPTAYHLMRFVETAFDNGVFIHLWLGRDEGNLALARIRLRDLADRLALI